MRPSDKSSFQACNCIQAPFEALTKICSFCNMRFFHTSSRGFHSNSAMFQLDQRRISCIVIVIFFLCMDISHCHTFNRRFLWFPQVKIDSSSNPKPFKSRQKPYKKHGFDLDSLDCIRIWFHLVCKVSARRRCLNHKECNRCLILTFKDIKVVLRACLYVKN